MLERGEREAAPAMTRRHLDAAARLATHQASAGVNLNRDLIG
jgi:hypothetical protein